MLEPAAELRGARRIYASRRDFAFEAHHLASADGTCGRHLEDLLGAGALLGDGRLDRGDDVAGLHEPDAVADADVLARDLVRIVERRTRDDGSGELDRLQFRDGSEDSGASDLDGDRLERRLRALGRVLVGARPARSVGGRAEDVVEPALVDLDDGAVDLETEGVAHPLELVDRGEDILDGLA